MRWSIGIASVVCCGVALALYADEEPCCGEQEQARSNANSASGRREPPPCGCPLYELIPLGGCNYLYYAEYFETSCEDEPEAITMQGCLPLSPQCHTNCVGDSRACAGPAPDDPFKGLEKPVDATYRFDLPEGDAADFSRPLSDSELPYIKYQLNPEDYEGKFAKVFVFSLDLKNRLQMPNLSNRLIYVALELKGKPPAGVPAPFVTCEPLETGENCHMYRAMYMHAKPPIPIILLTAK